MQTIIVPGHHRSDGNAFANLYRNEAEARRAVVDFTRILANSFQWDAQRDGVEFAKRIRTEAENKRRANIMAKWYRVLRGEFGYGYVRTMDEIPKALRAELNGDDYTPPKPGRLWTPEGEQ